MALDIETCPCQGCQRMRKLYGRDPELLRF